MAKRYHISRQVQDEISLISQQRTARAQQKAFSPRNRSHEVTKALLDKKTGAVSHRGSLLRPRRVQSPDTTLEGLLALKPHFDP